MIRRLVVAGTAVAVVVSAMPPTGAAAATEIQLRGALVSSATVSHQDVDLRLCPVGGDADCVSPVIDPAGAFSTPLAPDHWDVTIATKGTVTPYWTAHAQIELVDSDEWTLQLPELSTISLRVRDAGGAPLPGVTVTGGDDRTANDVEFSADLPAFTTYAYVSAPTPDAEGRSVFSVLPDSDLELKVTGRQGPLEYRVPLLTPNQTSVDAATDVSVRARALPIHNLSFRLEDYAGRSTMADYFQVNSPWGYVHSEVASTGPSTFPFPAGQADLRIWSGDRVWYLPASWAIDQPLNVTGSDVFTLTLPEPVRTQTTVIDADTGDVAEGVRVQVDGPADEATLAPGLAPATLTNGTPWLRATSNSDGGVQFRTFPDAALTASATMQGPGVYRTVPERDVDASADNSFTIRLPKSVVVSLDIRDAGGAQLLDATANLRVDDEFVVPFAHGAGGRPQMRITPGPAKVEASLGSPNIIVKRDVVVTTDTTLEYRRPELVDVTVVALEHTGAVAPGARVYTDGVTIVETDAGRMKAQFYSGSSVANAQGVGHVMSPPSSKANVSMQGENSYGVAYDVPLVGDRTVVVQAQNPQIGSGVPYALFDAPEPVTLKVAGTLTWRPVDAQTARFARHVASPFGDASVGTSSFSWVGGPVNPVPVRYPDGSTTCIRGDAVNEAGEGAISPMVCRTRPLDDDVFTRAGSWQRVRDDAAYGDSYVETRARGASLVQRLQVPAGERPGDVSLVAFTGPNAGSVRLQVRDVWVSESISLQGPALGEPSVLAVPMLPGYDRAALRGKVEVVVVSDGQRVRLDGVAVPVPTRPEPFLPPL